MVGIDGGDVIKIGLSRNDRGDRGARNHGGMIPGARMDDHGIGLGSRSAMTVVGLKGYLLRTKLSDRGHPLDQTRGRVADGQARGTRGDGIGQGIAVRILGDRLVRVCVADVGIDDRGRDEDGWLIGGGKDNG